MYQSEQIVVGLGNGTLLRFKKKNLQLEEIKPDIHGDQINSLIIDHTNQIMISASNDLSIAFHQISKESISEKVIMRMAIEEKINDMVGIDHQNFNVADVNGLISKFIIRY